jgi:hypothetical protein
MLSLFVTCYDLNDQHMNLCNKVFRSALKGLKLAPGPKYFTYTVKTHCSVCAYNTFLQKVFNLYTKWTM